MLRLKSPYLDGATAQGLRDACQEVAAQPQVLAVILTGGGDAFCDGGEARAEVAEAVAALGVPVIAALGGDALGPGLALALAADLRIATQPCLLGTRAREGGFAPWWGLTQHLPRLVGRARALEMLLLGEPVPAPQALAMGLVNRVMPPGEALTAALEWGEKMAARAPHALRFAKEAVRKGLDLTLGQALRLEADLYFLLHTTQDRTEGVRAFLEKRPPHFKGE